MDTARIYGLLWFDKRQKEAVLRRFHREADLARAEPYFPLKVLTCPACRLVQVDEVQRFDALFSDDYLYFSSYSPSWLKHAQRYVAEVVERLGLNANSLVMEVASNDGYLLQYMVQQGIPCAGVEPTESREAVARGKGVHTISEFFGAAFAKNFKAQQGSVDLVLSNNVLAHVPDINDFVAGLREVLSPAGTATVEFPHLMQLVQQGQFDTIYHEHFSYLSLHTVQRVFESQGLVVWDVQTLPTHGGSLRLWAQLQANPRAVTARVNELLAIEAAAGMTGDDFYRGLQARMDAIKDELLGFLIAQKRAGRSVAAYGAAAKGNTLLNYAGVRPDLLPYVVDVSPHKQGRYLPGSRIPIVAEAHLRDMKPDYVLILPWNLRDEITTQLAYVREWDAKFVTAVPDLRVA